MMKHTRWPLVVVAMLALFYIVGWVIWDDLFLMAHDSSSEKGQIDRTVRDSGQSLTFARASPLAMAIFQDEVRTSTKSCARDLCHRTISP